MAPSPSSLSEKLGYLDFAFTSIWLSQQMPQLFLQVPSYWAIATLVVATATSLQTSSAPQIIADDEKSLLCHLSLLYRLSPATGDQTWRGLGFATLLMPAPGAATSWDDVGLPPLADSTAGVLVSVAATTDLT